MNTFFRFAFLTVMLSAYSSQSNGEITVGNGGDVIFCSGSEKPLLQLYDHFEGKKKFGLDVDLGSENLTVDQKVEFALKRLRLRDSIRAERYTKWYKEFLKESEFLDGIELIDIPDSDGYIPNGCSLKQAAVQRKPYFPGEKRYTFSNDLWKLMDSKTKAGLILHEIVLRESIEEGQTNSKLARYFNSVISSSAFSVLSPKEYLIAIDLAKLRLGTACGVGYFANLNSETAFFENGDLRQGRLSVGRLKLGNVEFDIRGATVMFFPGGNTCGFSKIDSADVRIEVKSKFYNYSMRLSSIVLNEKGVILSAQAAPVWGDDTHGFLKFKDQMFSFYRTLANQPVAFYQTGYPVSIRTDFEVFKVDPDSGTLYFGVTGQPLKYTYEVNGKLKTYLFK